MTLPSLSHRDDRLFRPRDWGVGDVSPVTRGRTDTRARIDPKYEEEVSGCTACVGLITDDKVYIVGSASSQTR